jgi:glycosyltransferase involved in cell wall biosynthesis
VTRLNVGGPSIQAIGLSQELTAYGFDTCLIHGRLSEGEGDMTKMMPVGAAKTAYVNSLVRPVAPWKDVTALWVIYRTLLQWKPEIIHTHMAKAGTLGRLAGIAYNWTAGRNCPARLVHTYHGHVFEGYFGWARTRLFVFIERCLCRATDAVIAISAQLRDELLDKYALARATQIKLIPLGFHLDGLLALSDSHRQYARMSLNIPNDAVVVSTVGRLTAIKQHDLFLEMAHRLMPRSNTFLFLIVGDGELRAELEQKARDVGVEAATRFLGWQSDLKTIYAATDIFVLTSRNEGTPVALIEAMAAGLPTVSTDVGGVRDVVTAEDMGLLIEFGNAEALASAVASLADDLPRRQEMGRRARASVRLRFAAERLVADIRALYAELLSGSTT